MLPLASAPTLELNPAMPAWFAWLLLPMLGVAVLLIVMLYLGQRRLASTRAVLFLTAIRLALLLMLAVLLLQPAIRWTHTHTSAGTLWVLVDQSPSMQSTDPQADLAEHVHWAEALGYMPKSDKSPDFLLARLTALEGDFAAIRPVGSDFGPPSANTDEERSRARAFGQRLADWSDAAQKLQSSVSSSISSSAEAASILDALDHAASISASGASSAKSAGSMNSAAGSVSWGAIQANLDIAHQELAGLSERSEAAYVRAHAGDADVATGSARVSNVSRSDLAYSFLTTTEKRTDKSIPDILGDYCIRVAAFASNSQIAGTVEKSGFPDTLKSALSPGEGLQSTNIASGLQTISEQIAPDEPASVIIVSDGRHNVASDPTEPARALAARNVRVFGLLVGSHQVSADAAVEQIDAPEWVYKGDTLKAAALIRLDGLNGQTAVVDFLRGGSVVFTQNIQVDSNQKTQRMEFQDQPPEDSTALEYEVHVHDMRGETNLQNNHASFRVAIKKDKLYALIIEDRPRWEYRYIAASLGRDQRLKLQTILLNPVSIDRVTRPDPVKASPANNDTEAQLLPETKEEWMQFDIIVLGDIGPDTLTPTQQQFLAAAVRDKGATLITVAGQRQMPQKFTDMPLADLLPVTMKPQYDTDRIAKHARFGFRPALAPEGAASVLAQFGLDPDANAAFWTNLPNWYWHSSFTQAKPSASVIWSITDPENPAAGKNNALLATMSVGLGHSLYLSSDQTWRLRQVYGENIHERFWGQVLRWAVGSDLPAGGKFVRFGATQSTYVQGQPVTITARVLREDLTPYGGLSFSAHAVLTQTPDGATPQSQTATDAHFVESPESPGYYHATLGALPAGNVEISLQGPEVQRLMDSDPTVTQKTLIIKILPQLNVEQRNMNTDPGMLARITQAGGGFSIDANYADVLADDLPKTQRTETTAEQIGFFTDPKASGTWTAHWSFLGLFALLITLEWIIRKRAGLV